MKFSRKNKQSSTNKTRKHKGSVKKHMLKYMLQMLMTVKLYHWNTLSFSVHKATDGLYGDLNTLIDQFVEVLLGKHANISESQRHDILNINSLKLHTYKDNGKFKKELEEYKKFLMNLDKHFNKGDNSDLLNIRDEILATLNKMSYLLTLK